MSAPAGTTVLVGASGGIGQAVHRALLDRGENVIATYRRLPPEIEEEGKHDAWCYLDMHSDQGIDAGVEAVLDRLGTTPVTRLLFCSGLLHDQQIAPEKQLAELDSVPFHTAMQVNAYAPLRIVRKLLPRVPRNQPSAISAISARVGSISDNQLGGWYSYRMSKAALNMGCRTLSRELMRSHPHCIVSLYQPGTVATSLSAPFRRHLPASRVFGVERAAQDYLRVLDSLTPGDSGCFFDWSGQRVPF